MRQGHVFTLPALLFLFYKHPLSPQSLPITSIIKMAVPKKKISKSRRDMRRSHDSIPAATYEECPNCGETKRPHHICSACGQYNGREVVEANDAA